MALTGLFLCTFLVGHLVGNLQLFIPGEAGKRAFNEYAHFMGTNPFIKIMGYLTYISIIFHAIDGILLTIANKKARPVSYAHNKPETNSKWQSRNMALLGSVILIFIATHMANFWYKMKVSSAPMPLHIVKSADQEPGRDNRLYILTSGEYMPVAATEKMEYTLPSGEKMAQEAQVEIKNGKEFYSVKDNLKMGEGYKDLHSLVYAFFGQDRTAEGYAHNDYALAGVIFYVFAMAVLGFHLLHGFASAFQSFGLRNKKYAAIINTVGTGFSVVVPLLFALIPLYIYFTK